MKCCHGHTIRQVGCVSCVLVFDRLADKTMTRDELKKQYQQYQAYAKRYVKETNIKVSDNPNVQMLDDGAFIEAMIWIPKEEMEKYKL